MAIFNATSTDTCNILGSAEVYMTGNSPDWNYIMTYKHVMGQGYAGTGEPVPIDGSYENTVVGTDVYAAPLHHIRGGLVDGQSTLTYVTGDLMNNNYVGGTQGYVNVTAKSTLYEPLNITGTIGYYSAQNYVVYPVMNKKDQFRFKLKSNLCINVKSRATPMQLKNQAEKVALETLREVISEAEFRKYMRYGFVLVKGVSGSTYQIFRNRSHTKVWQNGLLVEEICVRIPDENIPPTDKIIAFRQIIRTSEDEFKKMGNVYKMRKVA